jgi:hypothetical protein
MQHEADSCPARLIELRQVTSPHIVFISVDFPHRWRRAMLRIHPFQCRTDLNDVDLAKNIQLLNLALASFRAVQSDHPTPEVDLPSQPL